MYSRRHLKKKISRLQANEGLQFRANEASSLLAKVASLETQLAASTASDGESKVAIAEMGAHIASLAEKHGALQGAEIQLAGGVKPQVTKWYLTSAPEFQSFMTQLCRFSPAKGYLCLCPGP